MKKLMKIHLKINENKQNYKLDHMMDRLKNNVDEELKNLKFRNLNMKY